MKDPNKQLEPAKHLKYFPDHQFEWKVMTRAPEYTRKKKMLEAFLIKSIDPFLNPFSTGILWKIGVTKKEKHTTLNACISKTKTNS